MQTRLLRQPAFSGQALSEERSVPPAKKRKGRFGSEHQELQLPQPSQEPSEPSWSQNLETPKKPKWKEETDSFLKNVPTPSAWRQKQVEVGLNSVKDYEKIIKAFISYTNVDIKRGPNQTALFKFKAFLLLSFCRALEQSGTSASNIDQIMQCITNASKDQQLRLRRSALWVNSLINELVKRGWNIYRATELFFINALSLTSLGFIRNDESLRLILKHLGTDEFVKHDFSDCLEPHYSVPDLVASLAYSSAKKLSMDDICVVLGYDPKHMPKSMERVHVVHAASDTSISLTLHVLTPGSFQSKDVSSAPCSPSALNTADPRCSYNQESTQRKVSLSYVSQENSIWFPQDQVGASFLQVVHESKDANAIGHPRLVMHPRNHYGPAASSRIHHQNPLRRSSPNTSNIPRFQHERTVVDGVEAAGPRVQLPSTEYVSASGAGQIESVPCTPGAQVQNKRYTIAESAIKGYMNSQESPFPTTSAYCSPAFSGHLNTSPNQNPEVIIPPAHQLYGIDPASQALATLLSFLGQSKIPEYLLERARGPLPTWGENGEVAHHSVNTVKVVQDKHMCEKAICDLHQLKAIRLEQSTDKTRYLSVDPQLLTRIVHDNNHPRWKIEAVKVVLYAFPMDRRLEPLHSFSIATSILPQLKYVLRFLDEIDVEKALPPAYVIEVCLSASYYSTLDWKSNIVATAESIGTRFSVGAQLRERVELRKRTLSRISSCKWGSEVERLELPRVDQRSNGYYGEFVLFNADVLYGRQRLQAAFNELDEYTPWHPENVSTLEQIQLCEMDVLRGKFHHFSGHFKEARRSLERVLVSPRPEAAMMCKAISHLTAVCCELGEARLGIKYASTQLDDLAAYQSRESGNAKRLRLALAYAYLMQGMWVIQPTASGYTSLQKDIRQGFDKAQELFQELAQSYENANALSRAGKTNRFSALLGLALIAHIKDDLHGARDCYDIALVAASDCKWDAGYAEAIIYWSKSVVMHSLGELDEARKLNGLAGSLYQCRSYFFVGLGTLWPDIIGTRVAQQGRERIIPQQGWETTTPCRRTYST